MRKRKYKTTTKADEPNSITPGAKVMKILDLHFGFSAEPTISGDYYKLCYKGETLYQDSACDDLYDEETAEAFFNEILDKQGARKCNVIKAAIDKGFQVSSNIIYDLDNVFVDAENFIIKNTDIKDCKVDIIDFNWGGANGNQSLYWCDAHNNVCIDEFGRILGDDDKRWSYYRYDGNQLSGAEWVESDDENVYVFVGQCVDTDGNVWVLLTEYNG